MKNEEHGLSRDHEQTSGSPLERDARDLANRLRGKYACGPFLANGEPEFGYREFKMMPDGKAFPAIHGEAASMIDQLLAALVAEEQVAGEGSREANETIATLQAKIAGLEGEKMPEHWRAVIGASYKPAVLRNVKHLHPTTVKEVFDKHLGTEVADVIAGLIFTAQIIANREEFLVKDAHEARDEALARCEAAEQALEGMRAVLRQARQFITNGVELGFIRMPTSADDPAHETLPAIEAALNPTPQGGKPDSEPEEDPCPGCGDGDKVPAKGYWRCPVCDAEWNDDSEEG